MHVLNFLSLVDSQKVLIKQSNEILSILEWATKTGHEVKIEDAILQVLLKNFTTEQFFKFFTNDRETKNYFHRNLGIGKLMHMFAISFIKKSEDTFKAWHRLYFCCLVYGGQNQQILKRMSALAKHEPEFEILATIAPDGSQIQSHALEALRMIRFGNQNRVMKVA